MEAREYIQRQIAGARRLIDATLKGITDEQLNWNPPGTANRAGVTLLHLLAAEDHYIHGIIQSVPGVWEQGGWSDQIGVAKLPGPGGGWEELKQTPFTVASLLAFGEAVRAATDDYIARLTPEELNRTVRFFRGERPVADVLATMILHSLGHTGEIAAIRGFQGVKGLPF